MAGRLGVLRRLRGDECSRPGLPWAEVRAESLRSSSWASCVRRSADAFGPGDVRGLLTLVIHDRAAGLGAEALVAFSGAVVGVGVMCECWLFVIEVVSTAGPATLIVRRSLPS